jgi:hypothetical protein
MRRTRWMLLALIALVSLVGCGTLASANTIGADPAFTSLSVVRDGGFPGNHVPPFAATTTDSGRIGKLYHAFLTLPKFPTGVMSCPADFGMQYQLAFTETNGAVLHATVKPDGCEGATMDELGSRWAAPDGAFWQTFADTCGVPVGLLSSPMVPRDPG